MHESTDDMASRPDQENREWTKEDFAQAQSASERLPALIGEKATAALVHSAAGVKVARQPRIPAEKPDPAKA